MQCNVGTNNCIWDHFSRTSLHQLLVEQDYHPLQLMQDQRDHELTKPLSAWGLASAPSPSWLLTPCGMMCDHPTVGSIQHCCNAVVCVHPDLHQRRRKATGWIWSIWWGEMKKINYFSWWFFPYPSLQDNPHSQAGCFRNRTEKNIWKLHIWRVTSGQVWIFATFGGIFKSLWHCIISLLCLSFCMCPQQRLQKVSHSCRGSGCSFELATT